MPRVIQFNVPAQDPERAAEFYRRTFGWTITQWQGPVDVWLASTGSDAEPGIIGAIAQRGSADEAPFNTIAVESMDAALAAVEAAGGRITFPKGYLPGVGWLAYCADTEGNAFGLLQADSQAH
ncbi:MAG: VOC family protein [Chloroflexi bacterium]|nr:VOC family protein [Chloroflexota bacterium]